MDPREELASALARLPISAAWIFGSQAEDRAGPLSDVDVGILPLASLTREAREKLRGEAAALAESSFRVHHADVVFVDEAAPHLAFAAISGKLIVENDHERRWMTEARIMSSYHDRRHADERWLEMTKARYAKGEFA